MYRNNILGRNISFKHLILVLIMASLGACGGDDAEEPTPEEIQVEVFAQLTELSNLSPTLTLDEIKITHAYQVIVDIGEPATEALRNFFWSQSTQNDPYTLVPLILALEVGTVTELFGIFAAVLDRVDADGAPHYYGAEAEALMLDALVTKGGESIENLEAVFFLEDSLRVDVRLAVVESLRVNGGKFDIHIRQRSIEVFFRLANDESVDVRNAAVTALREFMTAEDVPVLLLRLTSPEFLQVKDELAFQLILEIGEEATDYLINYIMYQWKYLNGEANSRKWAVYFLGEIGQFEKSFFALNRVLLFKQDPPFYIDEQIIEAETALPKLVGRTVDSFDRIMGTDLLYNDDDLVIRRMTIDYLGEIAGAYDSVRKQRVLDELTEIALSDLDPFIRGFAQEAINKINNYTSAA